MTIILPFSACLILHDRIGCCNLTSQEIMFSKFTFLNQNLNFLPTQHLSMPNSYPASFYAQFLPSIFLCPIPILYKTNCQPCLWYGSHLVVYKDTFVFYELLYKISPCQKSSITGKSEVLYCLSWEKQSNQRMSFMIVFF